MIPSASPPPRPLRVLFVFAWLVVGGEETEVRLLADHLDPARYRIDVVVCFHRDGMPGQSHDQLRALGVAVDTTPYHLGFEDTVTYLAGLVPGYDVVVSCQNVADIYPALERLALRPPLIEHGGLVSEAEAGPKHFTNRYVGVCETIRAAAAARMPGRERDALAIPSMVDLAPFDAVDRAAARARLGLKDGELAIGWLGRLDPKKRVEDFIRAAALVAARRTDCRFFVIGGPDAFLPDYAQELARLAHDLALGERLVFLGDRPDVPELLSALDIFAWLSRGEGMPHVIAEAGAARLPVIATPDNGALEQIADGISGLFVPHEAPEAVAAAMLTLAADPALRRRLGAALRMTVERDYSVAAVIPQWAALLDEVAGARTPARADRLPFAGPLLGGFECSSHRRHVDRARRDMIALTEHDRRAADDYAMLHDLGFAAFRDGMRWHLIEAEAGRYDFSSAADQLAAARTTGATVIWDLIHYGVPDWLDIWSADFAPRAAAYAAAAAQAIAAATPGPHWFCPINEISFFAWGGGDAGYLNPFAHGRGHELKVQLARASIAMIRAIRALLPDARFLLAEPLIHVCTDPARGHVAPHAEGHRQAQFQAADMIIGEAWPQLGGAPALLDLVGVNFYPANQWVHGGPPIAPGDPQWRPLSAMLAEIYARYGRPVLIAETGTEGDDRAGWLDYVAAECAHARALGVEIAGVCLYPVLGHLGWDDDRYCANGLLEWRPGDSERQIDPALLAATRRLNQKLG